MVPEGAGSTGRARSTVSPTVVAPGVVGSRAVLLWSFRPAVVAMSSAPVGGGLGRIDWLLNIGVVAEYARTDLGDHAAEVAAALDLAGTGSALFTALDVRGVASAVDGGVCVDATVGVTRPTWAADADDAAGAWPVDGGTRPGTVNIVAQFPVALHPAAGVNAVMTITEAKSQALVEAGVPGTGTASDAVVVCWPDQGTAEPFAGPRSPWGSRLARATHTAVVAGLARQ